MHLFPEHGYETIGWWLRVMPQEALASGTPVVTMLESEGHDVAGTVSTSVACTCGHGILQTEATSVSMTPTEPGGASMCDAPVTNKGSAVSPDTGSTQAGVVCADTRVHIDIRRATSGTGVKPQSESLLLSIPPVAIRAKWLPRSLKNHMGSDWSPGTTLLLGGPISIWEACAAIWGHGDNRPQDAAADYILVSEVAGDCRSLLLILPQKPLQNICWTMCCSMQALLNWTHPSLSEWPATLSQEIWFCTSPALE